MVDASTKAVDRSAYKSKLLPWIENAKGNGSDTILVMKEKNTGGYIGIPVVGTETVTDVLRELGDRYFTHIETYVISKEEPPA